MARQQRDAYVEAVLVQVSGEVRECLWCIAEPVQEKDRARVTGSQVEWTCACNYVWDGSAGGIRTAACWYSDCYAIWYPTREPIPGSLEGASARHTATRGVGMPTAAYQ